MILLNAHYISEFWAQAKKMPSKICARKMQKKSQVQCWFNRHLAKSWFFLDWKNQNFANCPLYLGISHAMQKNAE